MNKQKLYEIIDEYWEDYQNKKNLSGVIKDSIPIIWFGDINKYFTSNIRTITVGLNPSKYEFINKNVIIESLRFKNTDNFKNNKDLDNEQKDILIDSYNNYFKYNPYETWFKWNDDNIMKFMNTEGGYDVGYNAKYDNENHINTAIHIDCISAIATDPTISGLKSEHENTYNKLPNIELFIKFFDFLEPDVVLFSTSYDIFRKFMNTYTKTDKLKPILSDSKNYPKEKGYLNAFIVKDKLIIHGRNGRKMFAMFADKHKEAFFEDLLIMPDIKTLLNNA